MKTIFGRFIWLRNCGRFTHVSSDFGSQYYSHAFVTSEALYASLTRGATWRHRSRFVDLKEDAKKSMASNYFICDYDVSKKPVWFTPGIFYDANGKRLGKSHKVVDKHNFNVLTEGYPNTGGGGRPIYVPTYGWMECILPDQKLLTYIFSPISSEIDSFKKDQVFLLGKKRSMFQIVNISEIYKGEIKTGLCTTPFLQIKLEDVVLFGHYEVLATTMRYLIIKGELKIQDTYFEFNFDKQTICIPYWYFQKYFFKYLGYG